MTSMGEIRVQPSGWFMSGLRYISQLQRRWGTRAPRQMYRMWRLHRTSFDEILENVFAALEPSDAKFAFPTVASVARMKPELARSIEREGHEVASHGYNHVRYPMLSEAGRERDLALSLQTYRKLGIDISGFRAPYDRYTEDMPRIIDKNGLLWDGGFGYQEEHREKTHFFRVESESGSLDTTFIPLNILSDDLMIDGRGWGRKEVTAALKTQVKKTASSGGVVMFDLHPIRMGQKEYAPCLGELAEYAQEMGGWIPTPREAVTYWSKHKRWKSDHGFCLLLTGDIDNWVFSDYLRRMIWRRG